MILRIVKRHNNRESRRDQEEGGELDSHEEANPEEMKSREVALGWREREFGLLLLRLIPSSGAMDIVFVTVLHLSLIHISEPTRRS